MRNRSFTNSLVLSLLFCIQVNFTQSVFNVSIITSEIIFLRTERDNPRIGRTVIGQKTVHDYYLLKLAAKINENIQMPLDIKLTSPYHKEKIFRLEDNIKNLDKDRFYNYSMEIELDAAGWYKLELGDFTLNQDGKYNNIVLDKSSIYVTK